jgi:hypothetical protein
MKLRDRNLEVVIYKLNKVLLDVNIEYIKSESNRDVSKK